MTESRIGAVVGIDELAHARKVKESLEALFPFLTCPITGKSAKEYVDTLVKHDMLYFFEEDANDVLVFDINEDGEEYERTFTSKQATMLNVIRNRFRECPDAFEAMFNAVFSGSDDSLTDEDTAYDHMLAEHAIVDRYRLVN